MKILEYAYNNRMLLIEIVDYIFKMCEEKLFRKNYRIFIIKILEILGSI